MAITAFTGWSATAALNVDLNSIPLASASMTANQVDDAFREMMAQLAAAGLAAAGGTDVALADGGTGASLVDPNADHIMFWDDSAGAVTWLAPTGAAFISTTALYVYETIALAVSDETTAITTGTAKVTFRMPYAFTVTSVKASLTTASSSGLPTFDINEGGTTILSTKLTIDANELTSVTAATAAVVSDTALAEDAEMTVDIDVAGTGAKGAKIYIIGYRTA